MSLEEEVCMMRDETLITSCKAWSNCGDVVRMGFVGVAEANAKVDALKAEMIRRSLSQPQ